MPDRHNVAADVFQAQSARMEAVPISDMLEGVSLPSR